MIGILLDLGPLVAAAPAAAAAAAPYVAAGISALSGAAGIAGVGAQNRKSRAFSREMYQQQKADNIAFWNMQNEYNSPEKQMERLKNAGLNPNMLYDKTGAVIPAGNVSTPDVQGGQFRTPDFGSVGSGLVQGYFDTKIKQAQYDNLKAANTKIAQENALIGAQIVATTANTEGKQIDNALASANFQTSVEAATANLESTKANTQFTLDENTRKEVMQGKNLQLIAQDILLRKEQTANTKAERANIRQMLNNLKNDNQLKELDINLRKMGINPTDPTWMRIATQAFQPYMSYSPSRLWDNTMEYFTRKFNKGWSGAGGSW